MAARDPVPPRQSGRLEGAPGGGGLQGQGQGRGRGARGQAHRLGGRPGAGLSEKVHRNEVSVRSPGFGGGDDSSRDENVMYSRGVGSERIFGSCGA